MLIHKTFFQLLCTYCTIEWNGFFFSFKFNNICFVGSFISLLCPFAAFCITALSLCSSNCFTIWSISRAAVHFLKNCIKPLLISVKSDCSNRLCLCTHPPSKCININVLQLTWWHAWKSYPGSFLSGSMLRRLAEKIISAHQHKCSLSNVT